jgi:hypothetical protein
LILEYVNLSDFTEIATINPYKMPKRRFKPEVCTYISTLKTFIATTRFNNQTWKENQEYLKIAHDTGVLSNKIKCIYPSNTVISESIPYQSNVFVLEMNNDMNQILGIGLIRNNPPEYAKHQVYKKEEYNQFAYKGSYHIKRNELSEDEKHVIDELELLCFKGKRHQKRLNGIKVFPLDILYDYVNKPADDKKKHDFVCEIAQMFKTRFL